LDYLQELRTLNDCPDEKAKAAKVIELSRSYLSILADEINSLILSKKIPTIDQTQKFLYDVLAIVRLQKIYDYTKHRTDLYQTINDIVNQVHECIFLRTFGRANVNNDCLCEIIQVDYMHMDFVVVMEIAMLLPELDFDLVRGFG
jgi:hypothetical protein